MNRVLPLFLCLILVATLPATATAHQTGIDVSNHQGEIDWSAVAADGVEFALVKATEGNTFTDARFRDNARGAAENGIAVGAYHYARFSSTADAVAEAEFFLSVIGEAELTYPVALDLEVNDSGLTPSQLTDAALAFCGAVEAAGYTVLVYSYQSFFQNSLEADRLADYDLWVAKFSDSPPEGLDWAVWQYSDTGSVSGIRGDVDLDTAEVDFAARALAQALEEIMTLPADLFSGLAAGPTDPDQSG